MSERLGTQLQPGGLEQSIHTGLLGKGLFAGASLDLYFAVTKNIGPLVTFTRASSGTYVDSAGVLQTAATDVPRFDHNPTTGEGLGLLVEEARTNSIRNSTGVGAVAGTPGTLPTNWSTFTSLTGLTRQIVGTGTENGISYLDVKLSGTPSAAGSYFLQFETSTSVAASNGQTWTSSGYFKLAGGSLTGITTRNIAVALRDSGGGELGRVATAFTPTSSDIITQRVQATVTNNNASTTAQLNYIELVLSGVAIDITLRIGLPQLEQGASATSPILTSTAAATRAADVPSITGSAFSSWYRQDEGTLFAIGSTKGVTGSSALIQFDDTTISERIGLRRTQTQDRLACIIVDGGTTQANNFIASPAFIDGATGRCALAFASNDVNISFNGALATLDTTATMPTVTQATIGIGVGASYINNCISRITYWPQRLSDSTLQSLTQ